MLHPALRRIAGEEEQRRAEVAEAPGASVRIARGRGRRTPARERRADRCRGRAAGTGAALGADWRPPRRARSRRQGARAAGCRRARPRTTAPSRSAHRRAMAAARSAAVSRRMGRRRGCPAHRRGVRRTSMSEDVRRRVDLAGAAARRELPGDRRGAPRCGPIPGRRRRAASGSPAARSSDHRPHVALGDAERHGGREPPAGGGPGDRGRPGPAAVRIRRAGGLGARARRAPRSSRGRRAGRPAGRCGRRQPTPGPGCPVGCAGPCVRSIADSNGSDSRNSIRVANPAASRGRSSDAEVTVTTVCMPSPGPRASRSASTSSSAGSICRAADQPSITITAVTDTRAAPGGRPGRREGAGARRRSGAPARDRIAARSIATCGRSSSLARPPPPASTA